MAVSRIGIAALVFCGWHAQASAQSADSANSLDFLSRLSGSIQTLASRVSPAVVQIQVTRFGPTEELSTRQNSAWVTRQQSVGSGVIVSADGYIMTNAHVVESAQRIRVSLAMEPGLSPIAQTARPLSPQLDASVIGIFKEGDLALLKIAATGLPTLKFANYATLRQGQMVFAFGSPVGLDNSMSMGVVSAVARQLDPDGPMLYIQTDAAINPGNSGGALVNTAGELVGLDTFIFSQSGGNEGMGFAVPSALVRDAFEQLRRYGHMHRPEIGISVQTITPILASALSLDRRSGVLVSDIVPESPAATAGIKLQDIILAMDTHRVESVPAYLGAFLQHSGSDPVILQVLRGTQMVTLSIPPRFKDRDTDNAELPGLSTTMLSKLGVLGSDLNEQLLARFGEARLSYGVVIAARAGDLRSQDTGLQAGDIIHEINGHTVSGVEALRLALDQTKAGDPVALQVERSGGLLYLAFEIE